MEFRKRAKLFERGIFFERITLRNKQKQRQSSNNGVMTIKTKDGQVRLVNSNGEFVRNDHNASKPPRKHAQVVYVLKMNDICNFIKTCRLELDNFIFSLSTRCVVFCIIVYIVFRPLKISSS